MQPSKNQDNTEHKYIYKRNAKFRVQLPERLASEDQPRYLGTYDTLQDAITARDLAIARLEQAPDVDGFTPDDTQYDPLELWTAVQAVQRRDERLAATRARQTVTVPDPDQPFGLAYLSDLHIGNPGTDYQSLEQDCRLIQDTPRLYAGFHGDGTDNWIMGKLLRLQQYQAIPFDAEVQLLATVLEMLQGSLLWVVSGNHDNWTRQLAGIDRIHEALKGCKTLYHPHEVRFTLQHGPRSWHVKARHSWKYRSIFNATHAIEVGWQRGGYDFDIGIGAHTHIATVARPFYRHGRERYAVLIGTYKIRDAYTDELGLSAPHGRGCGAHVSYPDHRPPVFCSDLTTARDFLDFLLHKYPRRK